MATCRECGEENIVQYYCETCGNYGCRECGDHCRGCYCAMEALDEALDFDKKEKMKNEVKDEKPK